MHEPQMHHQRRDHPHQVPHPRPSEPENAVPLLREIRHQRNDELYLIRNSEFRIIIEKNGRSEAARFFTINFQLSSCN